MIQVAHIIGSGAIGSLLAAGAQNASLPVARHTRGPKVEQVRLLPDIPVVLDESAYSWDEYLPQHTLTVFPLKSYQIAPAIQQYISAIPENSPIILLHNGMGSYEQVAQLLSNHLVYLATTSHGAFKPDLKSCMHTGLGLTHIGAVGNLRDKQIDNAVVNWLGAVLPPVIWQHHIDQALWQKLSINALINPLTAIHDIKNGALASSQHEETLYSLAVEIEQIASAEGIELALDTIVRLGREVIGNTAQNYSSMHQDIKYRKPTEIEAITGFLMNKADEHGIDCPVNRAIYNQVIKLQASYVETE